MTEVSISHDTNEVLSEPVCSNIAELRARFYEESIHEELLVNMANDMQLELGHCLGSTITDAPRQLEDGEFETLFNPDIPTIAIDSHQMFAGAELLGVVAHEAATRVNIIYTSPLTGDISARVSEDATHAHLEITGGAIILPTGQVTYGSFPRPVIADRFDTVDIKLIEQCETYALPISTNSTRTRQLNDKFQLDYLSSNQHTYNPRQIARVAFLAASETDNLVIKPTKHSQGLGVLLTDTSSDTLHAKRFYKFLEDNHYEPIVQERARSRAITDPETQQRLDWNVRAIISYGELIGMYVRADKWGGPVNISLSAQPIHMDNFANYFKDPAEAEQVIDILHTAAHTIAAEVSDVGVIGIDLTVDESMRACLFEMNGGNVGGLQTMTRLEKTHECKLEMSRHLLTNHIKHTHMNRSSHDNLKVVQLTPTLDTIVLAAASTSLKGALGDMAIEELPVNDDERFGRVHALAVMRMRAAGTFQFKRSAEIDKILQADYPLELRRYILNTHREPVGGEAVEAYLDMYSSLFPNDVEILVLRADQLLNNIDLPAYRERILQAPRPEELKHLHLETFAQRTLLRWFGALPKRLIQEELNSFVDLTKKALSTYCHEGYDKAIHNLDEHLENNEMSDAYAQLIHSLQFCMAMGDKRGNEALKHFSACEEQFDDPWEFYENVVDQFCHLAREDMDTLSDEQLRTRAALDIQVNPPLVVITDTLDYLRHSMRSINVREDVVNILATNAPFDWDDSTLITFRRVLIELVSSDRDDTSAFNGELVDASSAVAAKIISLIDYLIRGEKTAALVLIDELAVDQSLFNDLEYLKDVYIDDGLLI